jgi:outer membrane protein OmpA-like peptidoglycan-associated protein/uncharacterized protein YidB (DUF937 family)
VLKGHKNHLPGKPERRAFAEWSVKMASFDDITEEIAARYQLGSNARLLVEGAVSFISAHPGGSGGFVNKFLAAGLKDKVASWLEGAYPMVLSAREVKKVMGAEAVRQIAQNAGVPEGPAGEALGFAIPKIIARMKQDAAAFAEAFPAAAPLSMSPAVPTGFSPRSGERAPPFGLQASKGTFWRRLVLPSAAVAVTIGLFGYAIIVGTLGDRGPVLSPAQLAQSVPAPSTPSPQTGVEEKIVTAGPGVAPAAVIGDLAVQAGWIKNLSAAFGRLGGNASQLLVAAEGFNAEETMPPAGRPGAIGSLSFAQLPEFVVAAITGSGPAGAGAGLTLVASVSPREEQAAARVEAVLGSLAIKFPPNSAKISARDMHLVRKAAEMIKQLPEGAVVELNGYTARTGNPAGDVEFSKRRAESVYLALVDAGVSPSKLRPQGLGSPPLPASMEGRSASMAKPRAADRRVEFRIVQQ